MFTTADIDLHDVYLDAFFGKENTNPARIGRAATVIEFHASFPRPATPAFEPLRSNFLTINDPPSLSLILRNCGHFQATVPE